LQHTASHSGPKYREYLNEVGRDELGASSDTLYRRGLVPLKDAGQIAVRKNGLNGRFEWRLTDDEGIPF
jgi:hypothetical protein